MKDIPKEKVPYEEAELDYDGADIAVPAPPEPNEKKMVESCDNCKWCAQYEVLSDNVGRYCANPTHPDQLPAEMKCIEYARPKEKKDD